MQVPLQISFENLDRSPAVEAKVRDRVEELEQFFGRIMSCRAKRRAVGRARAASTTFARI